MFWFPGLWLINDIKKKLELIVIYWYRTCAVSCCASPYQPMLQRSKIIRSRDEWKLKAVRRAEELREQRKTLLRYRQKVARLKAEITALETATGIPKKVH